MVVFLRRGKLRLNKTSCPVVNVKEDRDTQFGKDMLRIEIATMSNSPVTKDGRFKFMRTDVPPIPVN